MELKIDSTLKALRHERGNTQEDLARHLEISVQAVSKWERGDGLPDITLLPRIASYYNTTVDALLGCDEIRRQEEMAEFEKQAHILINKGQREDRLALCRAMQKKYPNDETVLNNLMYDLFAVNRTENSGEIIAIAERLMNSKKPEHRRGAIHMLAFTYNALGDTDKAVEYAEMIPAEEDLLVHVLKGEKLVEHCRWYFWNLCDKIGMHLAYLLQCPEAGYTAAERYELRKNLYDLYHVIFRDGDFGFWENRLGPLCFEMALSSAEMGAHGRAIDELYEMAEHFEKYRCFDKIDHTSPLVRGLHYEAGMSGCSSAETLESAYLRNISNHRLLACLKDDPRFIALKEKLAQAPASRA